ncbi:phosphate ABC transporter substrate-binding protein PstS [Bifidobacterium favimelis]|uniref:Phosphate-binding protein n=1 Tax=Bifidobacterium favimelis TaxID=3122979 RepID=A0ABU8ZR57_9BIFI
MRNHVPARPVALLAALSLAVCLGGCGDNALPSDQTATAEDPVLSGEFAGSGASSQQSANEAWIAGFRALHPGARISYDPAGSGAGVNAFLNGSTIWAGTDAPLTQAQLKSSESTCQGGRAFDIPVYATPIAVAYNLRSAGLNAVDRHLRLDPQTMAMIFDGGITNWNDARIARLNPGVDLPDLDITVVHRSDKSGTTKSFLSYLHDTAGSAWPHPAGENWPNDLGQAAKGTAGVVMTLNQAEGTIGYADAAQTTGLGTVAVKAGSSYTPPTTAAAGKALEAAGFDSAARGAGRLVLKVDHAGAGEGTYPILLVSYDVACQVYRRDPDHEKARFAKEWLTYVIGEEGQEAAARNAGSVRLGPSLRKRVMTSVEAMEVD